MFYGMEHNVVELLRWGASPWTENRKGEKAMEVCVARESGSGWSSPAGVSNSFAYDGAVVRISKNMLRFLSVWRQDIDGYATDRYDIDRYLFLS